MTAAKIKPQPKRSRGTTGAAESFWNGGRGFPIFRPPCGDVAQLGERGLCKPEVAGSIPVVSTKLPIDETPTGLPYSTLKHLASRGGAPL